MGADWSEQFKTKVPVEGVICDECKPEAGRLGGYRGDGEVRACAHGEGRRHLRLPRGLRRDPAEGSPDNRSMSKDALERNWVEIGGGLFPV